MKTIWHKSRCEEIIVNCPICGHQTAPPKYPYCSHTIFVFVEPSTDDASFDFMRPDFAKAWHKLGKKKPTKRVIASLDITDLCEVWEVSESSAYHPTTVVAGYEQQRKSPTPERAGVKPSPEL